MKQYKAHEIANVYPLMSKKEYENLLLSLEESGYDMDKPIYIYENKILDGRNRYYACEQLKIEPKFKEFKGTLDEAVKKSRLLNSSRRQLSISQRAMIAANEIEKTRNNPSLKNLSISKAALLHSISDRYINDAIKIAKENKQLASNVYKGLITISQAMYKLQEIEAITKVHEDADELLQNAPNQEYKDSGAEPKANTLHSNVADNTIIIDAYEDELEELKEQLKKCEEEKRLLQSNLTS